MLSLVGMQYQIIKVWQKIVKNMSILMSNAIAI